MFVCQDQKDTLHDLKDRMESMQRDRERDAEELRVRMADLKKRMEHEERMKKELEVRHTHTHRKWLLPYDSNVHEGLSVYLCVYV